MVNGAIITELERLAFPDILLWLLTFAIVFGILTQTKMPKSKAARGMISIAVALLVMFSAPTNLIAFLSQASSGLILVVIAILLLVAFFEVAGIKGEPIIEEGKVVGRKSIFAQYPRAFAIAFVLVAIIIFLGAGGWDLLGFGGITPKQIGSQSMVGIIFIAAVMIGVVWLIAESKD